MINLDNPDSKEELDLEWLDSVKGPDDELIAAIELLKEVKATLYLLLDTAVKQAVSGRLWKDAIKTEKKIADFLKDWEAGEEIDV